MNEFRDITPESHRCSCSMSCPSVSISEDGKTLRVTGKHVPINPETLCLVETTVEIPVELMAGYVDEAVKAENDRCVLILETMSTDADNRAEFAIGDALERGVGAIRSRGEANDGA